MSAIVDLSEAGRQRPRPRPSGSLEVWLTCPTPVHGQALCSEGPVAVETVRSIFLLSKWKVANAWL